MPWSHHADGLLRWGDRVMVQSVKTGGPIVIDVGSRVEGTQESYAMTTAGKAHEHAPVSRSILQVIRAEKQDIFGDDEYIRYGQKVKLVTCETLFHKPLYVTSTPFGTACYSQVSRFNETSAHAVDEYNSVWVIDHIDPNFRFEEQGN